MNFATVSTLVIRLFCAYQIFRVFEDVFYLLAKQATDHSFSLYHYTFCMMGARTFLAVVIYCLSVPLGKRIAKEITGPANDAAADQSGV